MNLLSTCRLPCSNLDASSQSNTSHSACSCLQSCAAAAAAAAAAHLAAYRSEIVDTQYTQLYHGSSGAPLNLTLEGQLLSQWDSGQPHYDAVYFHHMPPLDQLLTSLQGIPVITLLVNQSAVSGLPAALNQATTALLRVMVAAGGARRSSAGNTSSLTNHSSGQQARNAASQAESAPPEPAAAAGGGHLPSCLPDIRVSSVPLPLLPGEAAERVRQDAGALMLVLCMTMAASVLSASFVVFLVR
jgi:ATP-binding cassette subfamily A (ABC1) protein 1/ATP-binding cassette subfamily A (ABC1) protein 3